MDRFHTDAHPYPEPHSTEMIKQIQMDTHKRMSSIRSPLAITAIFVLPKSPSPRSCNSRAHNTLAKLCVCMCGCY